MRFGIVSDIHCNADGLAEALRRMGAIDSLLCLGDCVSQTRFSNAVVAMLRDHDAQVVLGNHDVEFLTRVAPRAIAAGQADPALVDWLRDRPERIEIAVDGKTLLMVHATPWTYDYVLPGSPAMKRFAEVDADYVLGGHTHAPFAGRIGRALVINPGSAGHGRHEPPDGMMLHCAVLDTATDEVQLIAYPDRPYATE